MYEIRMVGAGRYQFRVTWECGEPLTGRIERPDSTWTIFSDDVSGPSGNFKTLSAAEVCVQEWAEESNILMPDEDEPFHGFLVESSLGEWYTAKIVELAEDEWVLEIDEEQLEHLAFESRLGAEHALRRMEFPIDMGLQVDLDVQSFYSTFNDSIVFLLTVDEEGDGLVVILQSENEKLGKPGERYWVSSDGSYLSEGTRKHTLLGLKQKSSVVLNALFE
jgi:hypothetical protein